MNSQYVTLSFDAELTDIVYVNSSFDSGLLKIAYHGDNHNGSSISKESFESAIPTMFNCPVVCHYFREEDNLGAHDLDIVKKDGNYTVVNLTEPVGVVPESAKWFWKDVVENDGSHHEYLCTNVLLWKRQEAYGYIRKHGIVGQSMEINIYHGYKRSDGYKVYESFEFTAFCLLGEGVAPCFESASLEMFQRDDMHKQLTEMMDDFKREFAMVKTASADDTYDTTPKGGNPEMNMDELMAKYGLSAEDVDFDMSDMSEQDIEACFAEIKAAKDVPAPQVETPPSAEPDTFSLTANQVFSALWEVLSVETYVDTMWGEACEMYRYHVEDFDIERLVAYLYDCVDNLTYAVPFKMNGDRAEVDLGAKKRVRRAYVEYDEGNAVFVCDDPVLKIKEQLHSAYTKLESEVGELRTFKADTIKAAADAARKTQVDAVFAKFEFLAQNEEGKAMLDNLMQTCGDMTIEQIEDKCFSIKGRVAESARFSLEPAPAPAASVDSTIRVLPDAYIGMFSKNDEPPKPAGEREPYNNLFVEFGIGQN